MKNVKKADNVCTFFIWYFITLSCPIEFKKCLTAGHSGLDSLAQYLKRQHTYQSVVILISKIVTLFLVACTRLYTPLCRSVGWSVGRSVGRSVTHLFFHRFSGSFHITAPAQSHATDSAVYTALFHSNQDKSRVAKGGKSQDHLSSSMFNLMSDQFIR